MEKNPIFSYTKRDYESSRKEGLAQIPVISKGAWTDLNATDPGVIILDYVHALVDMINYYQDHQALETFIVTAKERANIFRLAKQLSYKVRSAKGAICDVVLTSYLLYDHPIRIPKYTSISSVTGINYLTIEDYYLPANNSKVTVTCSQGVLASMKYKGTGISRFSNIEDAANQTVVLNTKGIDIDSIKITDNTGITWKPVDYVVFSTEVDKVYQVDLNPDDTITIRFGDGERGVVPKEDDEFNIEYVVTEGENGKVGVHSLKFMNSKITDTNGDYVELIPDNYEISNGGSFSQSSSEIVALAPGAIKAQNRAVTLSDFENLAKLVDGVADAKAYDINVKPDLCLYHEVKVLIVPKDGVLSTAALNKNVYKFLYDRMIPPTNLQVLTPSTTNIDIEITVKMMENRTEAGLEYEIIDAVEEYFKERAGRVGESFYPSDLNFIVGQIPSVRYIVSITPSNIIEVSDLSVAKLGNIKVTVL